MFIVQSANPINSSVGAKCSERRAARLAKCSAPTELTEVVSNEVYKHSVPTGLRKI
jgi:hypothetical protein